MKVREVMTKNVQPCSPGTNLAEAAALLWQSDCGVLPLVNSENKVTGVITDRDICIALGTRNLPASEIVAGDVVSREVACCAPDDDMRSALKAMRKARVRRLPVVENGKLCGILSLHDAVLRAERGSGKLVPGLTHEDIVSTLKALCARPKAGRKPLKAAAAVAAAQAA